MKFTPMIAGLVWGVIFVLAGFVAYLQLPEDFGSDEAATNFTSVPKGLQLTPAVSQPAHESEALGMTEPQNIRDEALLYELTGREHSLTQRPIDSLEFSRDYDGGLETVDATMPDEDPGTGWTGTDESSGGSDKTLSDEDYLTLKKAKKALDKGDSYWNTWREGRNDKAKNARLKKGQEAYSDALELLDPLSERYPNSRAVNDAIARAQTGIHSCFKHRTQ